MPLKDIIEKTSEQMLRRMGPGELAELRRMSGPVAPAAYWRLAAECGFLDDNPQRWMPIIQIMALLTPKGDRQSNDRLHDPRRQFGEVLADGGDADWRGGGDARPFLSETRLARFLAAPAAARAETLTRLARALASTRNRNSGVNCVEIASLILSTDPALNKIAQAYYRRLDAARTSAPEESNDD
jgi:hypothetical protein